MLVISWNSQRSDGESPWVDQIHKIDVNILHFRLYIFYVFFDSRISNSSWRIFEFLTKINENSRNQFKLFTYLLWDKSFVNWKKSFHNSIFLLFARKEKQVFIRYLTPSEWKQYFFAGGVAGGVGSGYRLEDCKKNKTQQIQQIIVVVVLSPTITRTHTHTQTYTKYSNTHIFSSCGFIWEKEILPYFLLL